LIFHYVDAAAGGSVSRRYTSLRLILSRPLRRPVSPTCKPKTLNINWSVGNPPSPRPLPGRRDRLTLATLHYLIGSARFTGRGAGAVCVCFGTVIGARFYRTSESVDCVCLTADAAFQQAVYIHSLPADKKPSVRYTRRFVRYRVPRHRPKHYVFPITLLATPSKNLTLPPGRLNIDPLKRLHVKKLT